MGYISRYRVMHCPGQLLESVALRYRRPGVARPWPRGRNGWRRYGWLTDREREAEVAEGLTARSQRLARLEAVLFLAPEPLGSRKLAELASLADGTKARTLVRELNRRYDQEGCAFRAVEVAGGFRLVSREKFVPWLRRLHTVPVEVRLSAPAMETLAVVAYRQPVLRAEVEAIRGVQCGEILRQLMERELVRIVGRSEELGRPFLYGTTKQFLEVFGLRHVDELPRPALTRTPAADGPLDQSAALLGAEAQTPSQPIHLSPTEGGSNVTTALDTAVPSQETSEEYPPTMIEDGPSVVANMDEDFNDEEEEEEEDEDYDEEDDYDEDDYDEDDYDEDEDLEDDEDLEEDEWEEVEDDDEEDEEEEDDDWDDDDWDDEEDEEDDDWDDEAAEEDEDWDDEEDEEDEEDWD